MKLYRHILFLLLLFVAVAGCSESYGQSDPTQPEAIAEVESAEEATGEILPFPPTPSASVAGRTIAESEHQWRVEPQRLENPPNILIVMFDDAGFGQPSTFGGDINTPTLSRLAEEGIAYNAFHTTAICSPTRASLLTGRNHHRVGYGMISEFANDWDGYIGEIPHNAALIPEVLRHYGYRTSAFGKWHNTPTLDVSRMGPFDQWPTGRGFDYFYGFMGGETSQYEPRLYENTNPVEPPHGDPEYHLTSDMADHAIDWLRNHRTFSPDQPFFMYWTPGAVHGPHHIQRDWWERYSGQFDDGWDAMRERVYARQLEMGWIPEGTELTPRNETMAAWEDIPEDERPFQARLMEVFAGFLEHTDFQVGRLVDELERLGVRDNTIIIFIFSDNGASAEGMGGSIAELLAQNGLPTTVQQHIDALEQIGGLDVLGSPLVDNMYHSGWAWGGDAPLLSTKLIAAHFGGTRTPMVISWPAGIEPDDTPRPQFHHVNDIAATIYDILDIPAPRIVDGLEQLPLDGVSMAYSFDDPTAPAQKETQYFDVLGSRGVYHDGWMASTFGPKAPWLVDISALFSWNPDDDVWQLYNLAEDYSQANDLSAEHPERLAELQQLFLEQAEENGAFPIGGGLYTVLNPSEMRSSGNTEWTFETGMVRTPEALAPKIGARSNLVTVEAEIGPSASGVLYALCGIAGGISLFLDEGTLVYEYNTFIVWKTQLRSSGPSLEPGSVVNIEVETTMQSSDRGAPAEVVLRVDGTEVARGTVEVTAPASFSATETFDVGVDLGAPVSMDYHERAPFAFDGTVRSVHVQYLQ